MTETVEFVEAKRGPGRPPKTESRMFPVKLLRNYVPRGEHEIVGHHRPRIVKKDAAGRETVVQEAAFIDGEMMPAPYPGAGYANKIWANTVIRLPLDEARELLVGGQRAERADEIPA